MESVDVYKLQGSFFPPTQVQYTLLDHYATRTQINPSLPPSLWLQVHRRNPQLLLGSYPPDQLPQNQHQGCLCPCRRCLVSIGGRNRTNCLPCKIHVGTGRINLTDILYKFCILSSTCNRKQLLWLYILQGEMVKFGDLYDQLNFFFSKNVTCLIQS